jgi:tetratricopeptide (TPR) repeat protein
MVGTFRKNYIAKMGLRILGILFALVAITTNAGNDEEFFLRGNKQYAHKDYEGAFKAYDMVSKKGTAVLYNMGNCCFYKGDYAQALVYWSRAEIGATSQEYNKIIRNKNHIAALIGKQHEDSLTYKLLLFLQSFLPYISLFFLQLLFLLCWYLFIFLARTKEVRLRKAILSCVCLLIALCGALLEVHYLQRGIQNGVVVKKDAQLLVGPDKGFQTVCPLVYAHDVTVKEAREGWYKIQYADMIGWVEADVVQII